MGFLFNNVDDFRDKIKNKFGNTDRKKTVYF